jgi:recombinational DNA repair protein RecT
MNQQKQTQVLERILNENPGILDDVVNITELRQQESKLSDYLIKNADELWSIASQSLKLNERERYLRRLAKTIASDEKLAKCFDTPKGKMSIVKAMERAIELGVMPGEDAYIIPYGEGKSRESNWEYTWWRADLQPRAEAYMRICMSEPNPMFRKIDYDLVYENDPEFSMDFGTGEFTHKVARKDRGEIEGAWVRYWPYDQKESVILKYWDIDRIKKVRDTHSPTWKAYMRECQEYQDCVDEKIKGAILQNNGNYKVGKRYVNNPAKSSNSWITDPEQMILKTPLKGETKRYARMKPGLEVILDRNEVEYHSHDNEGVVGEPEPELESEPNGMADKAAALIESKTSHFKQDAGEVVEPDEDADFFDALETP